MTTIGWRLNVDAELEFAQPGIARSSRHQAVVEQVANRFLEISNRASAGIVHHVDATTSPRARTVLSWCHADEIARQANHRRFACGFDDSLGSEFFTDAIAARRRIEQPSPFGTGWLLKRPFGFAGRDRKHLRAPPDASDLRWIEASMERLDGGLLIEPFVEIETEFARHAWLDESGELLEGAPTQLVCDADGRFVDSRPDPVLDADEARALQRGLERSATALARIGYVGAFSIDAFRWRGGFRAVSELNARFSMGYFVGMRPCLAAWLTRVGIDAAGPH